MIKKKVKYRLGELELENSVYVSDPCYPPGTWCQAVVEGLKSGKWIGYMNKKEIKGWGIRVTDLWITHENYPNSFPTTLLDSDIEIGVDSGGGGIFDHDYYLEHHNGDLDEEWYDRQFSLRYDYNVEGKQILSEADRTERKDGVEMDGKCVVSFSGYGDGGYDLYAEKNQKGEIIALRIKFI
jgi:hypothetical protein